MADEAHRHLMLVVKPGFEGEQRQHQIAGLADLQHSLLPPCPDRRADVVDRLDPGSTQLELEPQIEIRGVDADEYIWPLRDQSAHQALAARKELRQSAKHFDEPHHRQPFQRKVGLQPFSLHARTTYADELDIGMLRLQRLHQARAENVTRGFPGNQRDPERSAHFSG